MIMSHLRVEYIRDEYTQDPEKKCDFCSGVFICILKCCSKKICQFHFRHGEEDGEYMSCESCVTHENIDDVAPNFLEGYIRKHNNVYCKDHNILNLCSKCEFIYYCGDHIGNHECI